ncbi:MAG TPA: TonB-dependent receptor [Dokdonella sp.]|nr:TonB-dependent receptor [Dokdonella sp.]
MNHTSNELFKAVRYALYAGTTAVVGLSAAPVLAQDDTSSQKLETITVTGSNIRRVDIETSNPVVTIDRAAIEKTGKLTLGDLVQQLPAVTGPNTNPQVNNSGGSGFSSIGLRGLGSTRTLVLINGHRYLSGDPNAIPANMIERIEVLTDGASSVYGSDAIAGVVNFILRSDYQGAEFSADYGISDHDDGTSKGYSFTFGQSSDKGSIMAGINYKKIDGVLAGHRDFSKNSVSRLGSTSSPISTFVGGSPSAPYGWIKVPAAFADLFPGCGRLARNPGASGLNVATDYHCFRTSPTAEGPSDLYNYATVNLIMTPQERTGLFLNGNYKLTDNVEAYLSVMHNKTSASFQLAPAVYGAVYGATVSADSYYNPFGIDFGPTLGDGFRARLESLGNRSAQNGTANDQLSTGFKGSFSVWNDQQWNWEVGFDYGHVHQSTLTNGLPGLDALNQASGPSFLGDDGIVHCGTPDNIIEGCTPFNPFNLQDPNSVAVLRASAKPGVSQSFQKETVKRLDLNGGLFELPAGTMQLAVGYNYRTEYVHSNADTGLLIDFFGNCALGSQCASALQGGYNVKEAYAELFVPILKDLPFVHALNLTVGDRWSKYNTFGSTNNTKFAIEWRPIEDLLLRGTVSKVFRAPNVSDIFGGAASDAPRISHDPCEYGGAPGTPNPNAGLPVCAGVPATGPFQNEAVQTGSQLNGIASGSAFVGFPIGPEKGKSFDFGVVYDPHWLEGMSISADVWRVYLNDNITGIGAQQVIDLCAAGQNQFCPLLHRFTSGTSQGQFQTINEPTGNLGRVDVGGVDVALNYRLPEFSFGRFNLGLNATYLKNYDLQTSPGLEGNTTFNYAGHFMNFGSAQAAACPGAGGGVCLFPRWRAQSSVGWQMGPFDASWAMRYIHRFRMGSPSPSQDTHPYGSGNPTLDGLYTDYGSTVYHDIQFGYNLESLNTRFDIGVNNVGDKQPPFLYANNTLNGNSDPTDFDFMGRYYWGRVTVKF